MPEKQIADLFTKLKHAPHKFRKTKSNPNDFKFVVENTEQFKMLDKYDVIEVTEVDQILVTSSDTDEGNPMVNLNSNDVIVDQSEIGNSEKKEVTNVIDLTEKLNHIVQIGPDELEYDIHETTEITEVAEIPVTASETDEENPMVNFESNNVIVDQSQMENSEEKEVTTVIDLRVELNFVSNVEFQMQSSLGHIKSLLTQKFDILKTINDTIAGLKSDIQLMELRAVNAETNSDRLKQQLDDKIFENQQLK